jgi:pyruvate dehydrogenase E2 component (dihydrolipoamide acetyltransferase)
MASEFRLPALGADMDAGTIVQWNVAPGSVVRRGDVVAVVETDKGAIDVEIFQDGVVREIVVPPGTKVAVGTVLALLEGPAPSPAPAGEGRAEGSPPPSAEVTRPIAPVPSGTKSTQADARIRISPAARKRARELGVDVASLQGSGPGGAITLEDVEQSGSAPQPAVHPPTAGASASSGMREAIAAAMSRSKREIPHYYLATTVDVTPATDWLAAHNAAVSVAERLLFATLLLKAVALTCREMPGFSGFYREGRFEAAPEVHVGVAVALRGGGLVAPAIMDTAGKSLAALMEDFRALVMRARAGRLRASELAAPTIILTSLGESSVDAVFPIIQPPQVAIVGAGEVVTRPWIVGGSVAARQVVTLSLGADHRVTDGRVGAQFLARIAARLAEPGSL